MEIVYPPQTGQCQNLDWIEYKYTTVYTVNSSVC